MGIASMMLGIKRRAGRPSYLRVPSKTEIQMHPEDTVLPWGMFTEYTSCGAFSARGRAYGCVELAREGDRHMFSKTKNEPVPAKFLRSETEQDLAGYR
jgi:hypothetical protein